MYSFFDANHWFRVKRARAELGLNRISDAEKLRPNHRLANATLQHIPSGEYWKVVSVREDWWMGKFLTALLEKDGSHRMVVVENYSCEQPGIVNQLGEFNSDFTVVFH